MEMRNHGWGNLPSSRWVLRAMRAFMLACTRESNHHAFLCRHQERKHVHRIGSSRRKRERRFSRWFPLRICLASSARPTGGSYAMSRFFWKPPPPALERDTCPWITPFISRKRKRWQSTATQPLRTNSFQKISRSLKHEPFFLGGGGGVS